MRDKTLYVSAFPQEHQGKTYTNISIQKGYKRKGSEKWENQTISISDYQIQALIDLLGKMQESLKTQNKPPSKPVESPNNPPSTNRQGS